VRVSFALQYVGPEFVILQCLYPINVQVGGTGLKLPSEKLEDMMGEHNMLIKRMLSSLTGKDLEQQQLVKDTEQTGFEELIKSLVGSPATAGLVLFLTKSFRKNLYRENICLLELVQSTVGCQSYRLCAHITQHCPSTQSIYYYSSNAKGNR
jgi:hypothetical protein